MFSLNQMGIEQSSFIEMNPIQKASLIKKAIETKDISVIAIAHAINESESTVYRLLKLNELTTEFQALLISNEIGFFKAYLLSSLPKEQQLEMYHSIKQQIIKRNTTFVDLAVKSRLKK